MSKYTIKPDDLTLAEVDEMTSLVQDKKIGQTTALAYVYIKRENPKITLAQVSKLKMSDLNIIEQSDEDEENLSSASD